MAVAVAVPLAAAVGSCGDGGSGSNGSSGSSISGCSVGCRTSLKDQRNVPTNWLSWGLDGDGHVGRLTRHVYAVLGLCSEPKWRFNFCCFDSQWSLPGGGGGNLQSDLQTPPTVLR